MKDKMENISKPLISVLIPVYNHECYVEECIRSIWNQNCDQVEIIAIDDGSTDNSYSVLERLKLVSPIPMYIERHANQGVVRTANRALQLSTGEYILCMASDDKILPGALSIAINEIGQHSGLTFAMYNARYFGDVNKTVYSIKMDNLLKSDHVNLLRSLYVEPPKPMLLQSTIIFKDLFIALGGWNQNVALDDWPIFIRLFEHAIQVKASWYYNGAHCLSGYRIHGSNAHTNTAKQLEMCIEVIQHYCPAELQAEAYANTYVDYAMTHIRRRKLTGFFLLHKAVQSSSILMVIRIVINKITNYFLR